MMIIMIVLTVTMMMLSYYNYKHKNTAPRALSTCLLYTSDAADE